MARPRDKKSKVFEAIFFLSRARFWPIDFLRNCEDVLFNPNSPRRSEKRERKSASNRISIWISSLLSQATQQRKKEKDGELANLHAEDEYDGQIRRPCLASHPHLYAHRWAINGFKGRSSHQFNACRTDYWNWSSRGEKMRCPCDRNSRWTRSDGTNENCIRCAVHYNFGEATKELQFLAIEWEPCKISSI